MSPSKLVLYGFDVEAHWARVLILWRLKRSFASTKRSCAQPPIYLLTFTGTSIKVDVNIASYLGSNLCVNFFVSPSSYMQCRYENQDFEIGWHDHDCDAKYYFICSKPTSPESGYNYWSTLSAPQGITFFIIFVRRYLNKNRLILMSTFLYSTIGMCFVWF